MAGKASGGRKRLKPKDNKRRGKKKISPLQTDAIEYLDYKDVDLLKRFLSDRAKIRPRRVSGNDTQQQRVVARAIKNAREMGLLPYNARVTTQRRGRSDRPDRGDRPERGEREERTFEDVEETPLAAELDGAEGVELVEAEVVEAVAGGEA